MSPEKCFISICISNFFGSFQKCVDVELRPVNDVHLNAATVSASDPINPASECLPYPVVHLGVFCSIY